MSVYIAPAAMGFGDLVVTLPIVQGLIADGHQTYLIVRLLEHLPIAARIPGLAGAILEWEFDRSQVGPGDIYYDLRDHDLQREAWWGSRPFEQAHPGLKINDILRIICRDLGFEPELQRLRRLNYTARSDVRNKVALIPGSAVSSKCWPKEHWLLLSLQLTQQGIEHVIIGEPEHSLAVKQLVEAGLRHLPTPSLTDALDVISSCRAVISVDTGLMHLAVNQQTPTVGVFRHAPVYVRPQAHFRAVVAEAPCADACYETEVACAHNHKPAAGKGFAPNDWMCQAPAGRHCMNTIAVESVARALQALQQLTPPVITTAACTPPNDGVRTSRKNGSAIRG